MLAAVRKSLHYQLDSGFAHADNDRSAAYDSTPPEYLRPKKLPSCGQIYHIPDNITNIRL